MEEARIIGEFGMQEISWGKNVLLIPNHCFMHYKHRCYTEELPDANLCHGTQKMEKCMPPSQVFPGTDC